MYRGALWRGPLSWVEPASVEIGRYDRQGFIHWLITQSMGWGDAMMVGVLEFLMDDVTILRHTGNIHILRDALGHGEAWAVCDWGNFIQHCAPYNWPEGYPRIWEPRG